jgi:hypothetical protein
MPGGGFDTGFDIGFDIGTDEARLPNWYRGAPPREARPANTQSEARPVNVQREQRWQWQTGQ